MYYKSTRNSDRKVTSAEAIARGISEDGGLFVPERVPTLTDRDFSELCRSDYVSRAKNVLSRFLDDYTKDELDECVKGAYTGTFDNDMPAPLVKLDGQTRVLELWHGPTCAFKDLALQLLPYLMTKAVRKTTGSNTVILVATSGDTGKAALEGFADVKGTDIIVFYPSDGVSSMQKRQMCTQKGSNVCVYGIKGNFDDAQTGVKKIFTDPDMISKLSENGYRFSSANSINWGRLVPQIVYYVSAYCDLLNSGDDLKDGFNVVVPTGNFGNILAAYYAKMMGVPIARLICASNENNVLTDFITTGVYDKNRPFRTTSSPSMDILVSSNLERLIYLLYGEDDAAVRELQGKLSEDGRYTVSDEVLSSLGRVFSAGCCNDEETYETIEKYYRKYGYLADTHTAVALKVYDDYVRKTGDGRVTVIASTASPYKFAPSVLKALGENAEGDDFSLLEKLSKATGTDIPEPLRKLGNAEIRFGGVCDKQDMPDVISEFLKLQ